MEKELIGSTNVMLVSANNLFREGLKLILHREIEGIIETAEANSFTMALQVLEMDIALTDLIVGDPGSDLAAEFAAIKAIRQQFPAVKILILTHRVAHLSMEFLHEDVAVVCVSKNISTAALRRQLLDLASIENLSAPSMPAPASIPFRPSPSADAEDCTVELPMQLTGREKEILSCLTRGLSNKMISRELNMAEATVKVHLRTVLRKIDAQNRTQAAIWALNVKPRGAQVTLRIGRAGLSAAGDGMNEIPA